MRLINTHSLELVDVIGDVPTYAILSHTWGNGEVMLSDMATEETRDNAARVKKSGFDKITKTCSRAREDGYRWAWVDSCCIDKTSSAELTEAINSMFQWYRKAAVCYAYIDDLDPAPNKARQVTTAGENPGNDSNTSSREENSQDNYSQQQHQSHDSGGYKDPELVKGLRGCRWMTRGWTLQELIAPRKVLFFDAGWQLRGNKKNLSSLIADITGIDTNTLLFGRLHVVPVARRMSWASKRQTTRPEDMAYCLLGIFDVNMPMLYGEGKKAFVRLQHMIMTTTNDLSLFAWKSENVMGYASSQSRTAAGEDISPGKGRGNDVINPGGSLVNDNSTIALATGQLRHVSLLAQSPAQFISCRGLHWTSDPRFNGEFSLTNMGLRMPTNLLKVLPRSEPRSECYVLPLNCCYRVRRQPQEHEKRPDEAGNRHDQTRGRFEDGYEEQSLGVYLVQYGPSLFARRDDTSLCVMPKQDPQPFGYPKTPPNVATPLYINTSPINEQQSLSIAHAREGAIRLRLPESWIHKHLTVKAEPPELWDTHHQLFLTQMGRASSRGSDGDGMAVADGTSFFKGRWTVYFPREPGEEMSELQILVGTTPLPEKGPVTTEPGSRTRATGDHDHHDYHQDHHDRGGTSPAKSSEPQLKKGSQPWVTVIDFSKESLERNGRQRRDHISLELAELRAAQGNYKTRAKTIWGKTEVEVLVSGQYEEYCDRPRDEERRWKGGRGKGGDRWVGDGGGHGGLSWNVFTVTVAFRVIGERKKATP